MPADASKIMTGNPATTRGVTSGENDYRLKRVTIDDIFAVGADSAFFSYMCDANARRMGTKGVSQTIKQMNYNILEDTYLPHRIQVNNSSGYNDKATAIVVDMGKIFRPQTVVKNERSGEQMLVRSVSGNTVTFIRGYGTTAAAAINDNDTLRILSTALSETSKPLESIQTRVTRRENMMQLYAEPIDLSKLRDHTSEYGAKEQLRQENNTRWNFFRSLELSFLFSEMLDDRQGASDVKDSALKDRRCLTGGFTWYLQQFASQNIHDFNGHMSWNDFVEILYDLNKDKPTGGKKRPSHSKTAQKKNYSKHRMVALCGHKTAMAFSKLIERSLQTKMMEHEYGFVVDRARTPFGSVDLYWHRWMDGPYEDNILLVEPSRIFAKTHEGFDFGIENVTNPDEPRRIKRELSCIKGFGMANPEFHGWIRGVQSIS